MKILLLLTSLLFCFCNVHAEDDKKVIPKENGWEQTNDRDNCSPQLYQSEESVYVYSKKQLDDLTIGIIDMQGNTFYYEVTTIPACTYYAISIESLPAGQYYICVYQESNYLIGQFNK